MAGVYGLVRTSPFLPHIWVGTKGVEQPGWTIRGVQLGDGRKSGSVGDDLKDKSQKKVRSHFKINIFLRISRT